eukprot:4545021-Pleurochrysis_carterae.AAC.2
MTRGIELMANASMLAFYREGTQACVCLTCGFFPSLDCSLRAAAIELSGSGSLVSTTVEMAASSASCTLCFCRYSTTCSGENGAIVKWRFLFLALRAGAVRLGFCAAMGGREQRAAPAKTRSKEDSRCALCAAVSSASKRYAADAVAAAVADRWDRTLVSGGDARCGVHIAK